MRQHLCFCGAIAGMLPPARCRMNANGNEIVGTSILIFSGGIGGGGGGSSGAGCGVGITNGTPPGANPAPPAPLPPGDNGIVGRGATLVSRGATLVSGTPPGSRCTVAAWSVCVCSGGLTTTVVAG